MGKGKKHHYHQSQPPQRPHQEPEDNSMLFVAGFIVLIWLLGFSMSGGVSTPTTFHAQPSSEELN